MSDARVRKVVGVSERPAPQKQTPITELAQGPEEEERNALHT